MGRDYKSSTALKYSENSRYRLGLWGTNLGILNRHMALKQLDWLSDLENKCGQKRNVQGLSPATCCDNTSGLRIGRRHTEHWAGRASVLMSWKPRKAISGRRVSDPDAHYRRGSQARWELRQDHWSPPPPFIFISWRLITLQCCSGFCHTLTWISHGFTCIPHPGPLSHLPLYPIPLGLPSAPDPSTCLMHPTWAGDLFHPR